MRAVLLICTVLTNTLVALCDGSSASAGNASSSSTASASASSSAASSTAWVNSTRRADTLFGIGYEIWWDVFAYWKSDPTRQDVTAEPVLGYYNSSNATVLRQQAEWISDAGIDFVLVDFSNSLNDSVFVPFDVLFDVYSTMDKHPQISILLSTFTNGTLDEKIERAYGRYMSNQTRADMFVQYQGKPLVTFYTNPDPAPPPVYSNPDYTIRFMGALDEFTGSEYGAWSWLNRAPYVEGQPTNMTNFSAPDGFDGWTADTIWSVSNVSGYIAANTQISNVTADSFGNLTSPPFTITEPAMQWMAYGADGNASPNPTKFNIRNVFALVDATTGEVLRTLSPPGSDETGFYLQQWNTRDLIGRNVTFVANGYGWNSIEPSAFGFTALQQVSSEFVSACTEIFGNGGGGVGSRWDTHTRLFGAYYVYQMLAVYDFEPDIALVQQWNEFIAPDEYSVESGNDMEPTKITNLAGVNSDGWGMYYLNLTQELISQYRAGAAFPAVMLDTRYP